MQLPFFRNARLWWAVVAKHIDDNGYTKGWQLKDKAHKISFNFSKNVFPYTPPSLLEVLLIAWHNIKITPEKCYLEKVITVAKAICMHSLDLLWEKWGFYQTMHCLKTCIFYLTHFGLPKKLQTAQRHDVWNIRNVSWWRGVSFNYWDKKFWNQMHRYGAHNFLQCYEYKHPPLLSASHYISLTKK